MQDTNYKRLRSSWLLLLVYVPMLLAVTLHRHDGVQQADDAFYCEDCARNVHHDGHLVAFQPTLHACVLCQLQSIPYLPPLLLTCAVIAVPFCVLRRVAAAPLYAPRPRRQPSPSTSLLCLWTVTAVAATFSQPFVVVYSGRGALSYLLSESSLAAPQALLPVRDG